MGWLGACRGAALYVLNHSGRGSTVQIFQVGFGWAVDPDRNQGRRRLVCLFLVCLVARTRCQFVK